jgi:type III secretion system FlhB-like substrate exporter
MPFPFDVKEMEAKNFRDSGNGKTSRAVLVENDQNNPIPVVFSPLLPSNAQKLELFNQVSSIAPTVITQIISFIVPASKLLVLERVCASGDNVSKFILNINGSPVDIQRSSFTDYNVNFCVEKVYLNEGESIDLFVSHNRPSLSDYNATIKGIIYE